MKPGDDDMAKAQAKKADAKAGKTETASGADWQNAARQYWDGWFDTQRKTMEEQMKTFSGMQGQWSQVFSQWQDLTAGNAPQPAASAFRDLFTRSGEQYIKMLEQFYQAAGQTRSPEDAVKEWMGGMQKFFETALAMNGQPYDPAAQYRNFTESLMNAGPAYWTTAFKAPFFGAQPQQQQHAQTPFLFDPFGFYASMPGIGYTREKQEHLNKLYLLFVEYEGGMRKYNTEMTKVGLQALHAFHEYLRNPPEGAPRLESLKSVYAKWVDVCEDVFAKYAMSGEYTAMYGEVVNALMAFKKQLHLIADDMVEQMNLPTRAEIDSLHEKVQELKRDNIRLRKLVEEMLGKQAKKGEKK